MTDPKDLPAVLDLPEEERWKWLYETCDSENIILPPIMGMFCTAYRSDNVNMIRASLAELAFRLIKEVGQKRFAIGACAVFKYKAQRIPAPYIAQWLKEGHGASRETWYRCQEWILYEEPIVQIIAALIAKEKK